LAYNFNCDELITKKTQ